MKVLTAGAGLAGLSAAWDLTKSGAETTVFEAKKRVGGRSYSRAFENGSTVELGGEYLFPDYFAIRKLAAELGIPIFSHGVTFFRRVTNGERQTVSELLETRVLIQRTLRSMKDGGLKRISAEGLFIEALGDGWSSHPVYRQNVTALMTDPTELSAEGLFNAGIVTVESYVEDAGRFAGGNQSIALELARRMDGRVRLETPVTGVSQSSAGVEFTFADGTRAVGDAAVIAVPLTQLQKLQKDFDWTPPQETALANLTMAKGGKIGLVLKDSELHGPTSLQSGEHFYWTWQSLLSDGERRNGALSGSFGTDKTLESLNLREGPERLVESISGERPGIEFEDELFFKNWAEDEWTLGSYSMPGLDWTPADRQAFDEQVGRVALAGEHTGTTGASLNSAVETGLRAANQLLKRFQHNR